MAVLFYRLVKGLEYQTANPGQDFNEREADDFEFDEENAVSARDVARPVEGGNGPADNNQGSTDSVPVGRGMSMSPVQTGLTEESAFDRASDAEHGRAHVVDKQKEASGV